MLTDSEARSQLHPHVVTVGAGFGGLYAARALAGKPVRVTVIDRRNHHLFQPLLYQVATAALSPGDIASPIRAILRRQRNVEVFLAEAVSVNVEARKVILADGEIGYDYLILATGVSHAYFGHDEWADDAPGLKDLEDAIEIRRRILLAFEAAERETDEAIRRALLTFVIVGAGPTGLELAGALAEISRHTLARDFRNIDPKHARVILLEGSSRVLPSYPEDLCAKAEQSLRRLGVEVRTRAMVTSIGPNSVRIGTECIDAFTIIWAAGVAASHIGASLGTRLDKAGRVVVEPDLTIPDHREIFVIGDLACFLHQGGRPLPGVAPVAIQQGRAAATNILRACQGLPYETFRYVDKGNLATIGRAAAVAEFGRIHIAGFLAWLAWLFVHILFLIGFRNRVIVLFQWAWIYFTYQRAPRLITGEHARLVNIRGRWRSSEEDRERSRAV